MEWQLALPSTHTGHPDSMTSQQPANWRLRLGFILSAIVGVGWGVLLGWLEIRVNAWLSPWLVLFVGMPAAFFGSMLAGLAFNRMLLSWHKLARLLIALLIVTIGFPFGLIWGILGHGYDALQLVNESGSATWILEWSMAILGLFGGMLPKWTLPFLKLFARLMAWLGQGPAAILRWLGNQILAALKRIIDFFEILGHALLWLPRQIYESIATFFQNLETPRARTTRPPEVNIAPRPTPPRRPGMIKRRLPRKPIIAKSNGHNGNSLRVTGVIEERCPYCLDVVKKNDPRGIKKCEVCGTPHHADCWAITGKCQVPHLNT